MSRLASLNKIVTRLVEDYRINEAMAVETLNDLIAKSVSSAVHDHIII